MSVDCTQWFTAYTTQTPGDNKRLGGHTYEQLDTFSHQTYNAQGMLHPQQPPLPAVPFPTLTPDPAPWYPPGYIVARPSPGIAQPRPRVAARRHWQAATFVAPPPTAAGYALPTRSSGAALYASSQASTPLLTRSPASASPASTNLSTPTNELPFNIVPAREEPSPEPFSIEPWQVSTESSLAAWNGGPVAPPTAEPWYAWLSSMDFSTLPLEPTRPRKRAWAEFDEDQGASSGADETRSKRPKSYVSYEGGTSAFEYPDAGMPMQEATMVPHQESVKSWGSDIEEGVPDADAQEGFTDFEQGSLWQPIASVSGAHGEVFRWQCPVPMCTKDFARVEDCSRHFKGIAHRPITNPPTCYGCNTVFTRKDALKRHLASPPDPTCTNIPPPREDEEEGEQAVNQV
ncbi:hypothetical protein DENSPDRAFT_597631 [Dentipellis sp. KUC8613]|nr:hypothetical protein DENSPDRAFT_597631 [Dentipellis sp. KUC8613]